MKRDTVRQRFQRFNSFRTGYPGLKQPWARTSEPLRRSGSTERIRCFVLATLSAFCSSERLRCFVQANAFGVLYKRTPSAFLFKRTPSAFCSSERLRRFCSSERLRGFVQANAFGVL